MQPKDPANPLRGGWVGKTVGGQAIESSQAPDDWLKTPQGQLEVAKDRARAAGIKEGTAEWKYAVDNGKLAEPRQPVARIPDAATDEFNQWQAAIRRDNGGKPPTSAQIEAYRQNRPAATGGYLSRAQFESKVQERNKEYDTANAGFNREREAAGGDPTMLSDIEGRRAARQAELDSRWSSELAQADPEGRYAPQGGGATPPAARPPLVAQGSAPARSNAAPAPAPVRPAPAAAPQLDPRGAAHLKEGVATTFANGQTWTMRNGQPLFVGSSTAGK